LVPGYPATHHDAGICLPAHGLAHRCQTPRADIAVFRRIIWYWLSVAWIKLEAIRQVLGERLHERGELDQP